ncbi:MAG: type VI secretion system tube protein Hcp [Cellvibrionaceae bacterium]|nr:type VI secretion system tube protein Hcp [Cellvibrionaceae bacterium]
MSIFVKYGDIKGESSDDNHKEWIDAEELDWGVSRQITSNTSTQGDRESSNATISDLTLTKFMDKSTARLFIESCCGTGKDVTIELTKTGTGGGSDTYIQYILHNALISSFITEHVNDSGFRPVEEIKISFTSIEMKYITYDEDGNPLAPVAVGFDTKTNTKK